MRNVKTMALAGAMVVGLAGCASTPTMDELTQLNADEFRTTVQGNTWVSKHDWGTWAEYHAEENSGYAKAWGNWGTERATSSYSISDDGEACWVYTGDHEWSKPEYRFCSVMYVDQEGVYYAKSTQNTYKPERVGKLKKIQFKEGDTYGLAE